MIDNHLEHIKKLESIASKKLKHTKLERILFSQACTTEETGELAKDVVDGDLEHAKSECIDIVIAAMATFYSLGGINSLINKRIKKQLEKWERKIYES